MQLCGLYLNRTLFVSTLGFVPVAIVIFFSEPILISIGQDKEVIQHTMQFLSKVIPAMYMFMVFQIYRRWLNQMKLAFVAMIISILSAIIFLIAAYVFAI